MNIDNIKNVQKEYYSLISNYKELIFDEEVTSYDISRILDIVTCFWLDKLEILEFEIDRLTEKYDCTILSGAIYLDVKENEHYLFKALGDYHLLHDPLLKLEHFFGGMEVRDEKENIALFQRSYSDTLEVLKNYNKDFFILPINLIVYKNEKSRFDLGQTYYLQFLSNIFKTDYKNNVEFTEEYNSYKKIEKQLPDIFRYYFSFGEEQRYNSLEESVESYLSKVGMTTALLSKSSSEKFSFVLSSRLLQVIDILSVSFGTNTYPSIRDKNAFSSLRLIMCTFLEKDEFKSIIEKAIIFFVFYYIVDKDIFVQHNFEKYCDFLKDKNILENILNEISQKNIDLFKYGNLESLDSIIKNYFTIA